jgi:hypothetical protein
MRIPVRTAMLARRAGFPALLGSGCLAGECCADYRARLIAPFPPTVPLLSVIGKRDAIVDRATLVDPAATAAIVDASHLGLIVDRDAYAAIARFLVAPPSRATRPRPEEAAAA